MNTTLFEETHMQWYEKHLMQRKGERLRRLKEGHAHAEQMFVRNVWWPAFGHFANLHPEFEIKDFSEGFRYLDFAFVKNHVRIAIEVDGYGPHVRNISRRQFSDQWVRQMHLTNDGWIVVRVSYDDIEQRPRLWQQLLQQMMGRLFGESEWRAELIAEERDIIRLVRHLDRPVQLIDVRNLLGCGYRTARNLLLELEQKGWLQTAGRGTKRIHSWRLAPSSASKPYVL
ncbi:DNA-binding response regulator [Paenibacillus sp. YIM B09110]|uniref:DNA-binding response regulator n=1 Tax=Paenibacillus sp. YIM B09110 TaxID=3126102 RepID=UPI00301DA95A